MQKKLEKKNDGRGHDIKGRWRRSREGKTREERDKERKKEEDEEENHEKNLRIKRKKL